MKVVLVIIGRETKVAIEGLKIAEMYMGRCTWAVRADGLFRMLVAKVVDYAVCGGTV